MSVLFQRLDHLEKRQGENQQLTENRPGTGNSGNPQDIQETTEQIIVSKSEKKDQALIINEKWV